MVPFDYRILNSISQKEAETVIDWFRISQLVKDLELEPVFSKLGLLFLICSALPCHLIAYACAIKFLCLACLQPVDLRKL